jgi:predicted transcriptional regulator
MSRPRLDGLPPYVYYDKARDSYVVRNPLGEKKCRRFADREEAIKSALALALYIEKERQAALLDAGHPTVFNVVESLIDNQLAHEPWKPSTRRNCMAKIRRIQKHFGKQPIHRITAAHLSKWLKSFCGTADQYNKWRDMLETIWDYAFEQGHVSVNEAAKVMKHSTSLNLEENLKVRQPLDLEGFQAIRRQARPWLQLAMDIAIVTLQGRNEVVNMKHSDFRDGYLYVIRKKTSNRSKTAFIRIPTTADLLELKGRGLLLDGTLAPNLIHRRASRQRREWVAPAGEHWAYVRPEYLTNAFYDAREASGHYAHLDPEERPTFHEIRGLGARLYRDKGVAATEIQLTLTHADEKTTAIYLNGGAKALRDEHFTIVNAPLPLAQMVG